MWTPELESKLVELEKLRVATRNSMEFLKASKERDITPEELSVRIAKMQATQTKIMERICAYAVSVGGKVIPSKPEGGVVYGWHIKIKLTPAYMVEFSFGRAMEPEIYDLALSHQCWIAPIKKSIQRWYLPDRGYNDCESVPAFRADLKDACVYLSEHLLVKIPVPVPKKAAK